METRIFDLNGRTALVAEGIEESGGSACRGAFNNTEGPTLGGHAIRHAVMRAGLDPSEVEDVAWGCALIQGSQSAASLFEVA